MTMCSVVADELHLGALVALDDVLGNERVEAEQVGDLADFGL